MIILHWGLILLRLKDRNSFSWRKKSFNITFSRFLAAHLRASLTHNFVGPFNCLSVKRISADFEQMLRCIMIVSMFAFSSASMAIRIFSGWAKYAFLAEQEILLLYLIRLLFHKGDCFENVSGTRSNIKVCFYFVPHWGIGFYDKIY